MHGCGKLAAHLSLAVGLGATLRWADPGNLGGDGIDYIDAARNLSGPTRFPPGFPLLLAPFSRSVGAMQVVCVVVALALVASVWWAAVRLGGWRSGVVASLLMLLSPGVTSGAAAIMSDRAASLLVVGAVLAMLHGRERLAGLLVGLSAWVRLVQVAFVAALPRRAWLPAVAAIAGLAAWQLGVKGSLLGYDPGQASFALANIFGNVSLEVVGQVSPHRNAGYFPVVLFGLQPLVTGSLFSQVGHIVAPFVIVPAVIGLRRFWDRSAAFAIGVAVLNLAVYLPYFFQSARFVLPGACVLIVYAAAAMGSSSPAHSTGDQSQIPQFPLRRGQSPYIPSSAARNWPV